MPSGAPFCSSRVMPHATDTLELLRLLHRHGVDFIVVGMTAGVLQGAHLLTFDLDVVYSRDPENLLRLLAALREIDARFRGDDRRLGPNISHLESPGHKLLETKLGDLDALGMIDNGVGYEGLIADAILLDTGGVPVRVLSLRRLIEVKQRAGRPKDLAVLPVLRTTLERIEKKS
jgi:hypothetical protein